MTANFSRAGRQRLRVITIGITLLLVLWLFFSPFGIGRYYQVQQRLAALDQEIATLEKENLFLAEKIERLENDGDYLERLIRKRYGLVKENEIIFDFSR